MVEEKEKRCFEPGCLLEVEYSSKYSSLEIYSCKLHAAKHYTFEPIMVDPCQKTKEALLAFLNEEKSKHSKLLWKIVVSFSKYLFDSENNIRELIINLTSFLDKIDSFLFKISQAEKISISEQDRILRLLSLQPDEALKRIEMIILDNCVWWREKIEFEANIEKRLAKIETRLQDNNQTIKLKFNMLANVKDSIWSIINEKYKSWKEIELWKEAIKIKTKNETSLLNPQTARIIEDLNHKLEEAEKFHNFINILVMHKIRDKRSEIFSRPNDQELEKEFRRTCSLYKRNPDIYDTQFMEVYKEFVSIYHNKASLYSFRDQDNLWIYDTENETKESKILKTPEPLNDGTCITQLPNGKLWVY